MFAPIKDLAERYGVTVVCVIHLNKQAEVDAMYRVSGSMAYVAAGRAIWLILKDQSDSDNSVHQIFKCIEFDEEKVYRYFTPVKCNLSKDDVTFVFSLSNTLINGGIFSPSVKYEGIDFFSANDIIKGMRQSSADVSKKRRGQRFPIEYLSRWAGAQCE